MEAESICSEPQCLQLLESFVKVEIEAAEKTLRTLGGETRKAKATAQAHWHRRKVLLERIRISKENIRVLTVSLNSHRQKKYNVELANKIELAKLNMDDEFKARQAESQKYEDILKQYENTTKDYRAKYEEFPLAKARREAQMRLKKIQVEKMMVDYKIKELKKISRHKEKIAWLRLRGRIVEFARDMLNNVALDRKLMELNKTIKDRRDELKAVDEEIAVQLMEQEEKRRIRELEMLKMPPPKINLSDMKSRFRSSSREDWRLHYEDSLDSVSVDMMMEEMCLSDETSLGPGRRSSFFEVDKNHGEEAINTGSPYPAQDEEMEQENTEPEAIDTPDEEPRRQPDPEEHPARDKQTSDVEEDIPPKRIKLMTDEPRTWNSPAATLKASGQPPRRSQQVDLSHGPRITKIETVRCSLPQKLDRYEPNRRTLTRSVYPDKTIDSFSSNITVRLKDTRLDLSPGSRISKTEAYDASPLITRDQVNPASMFSPGYSESSLSFSANKSFDHLKADQISLYEGSVQGFNPSSDTSEHALDTSFKAQPPVGRARDLPQISFSNILKPTGNKGSKHLF
ncbi:uncharacterized protein LOC143356346 [Halictus rubicundus]|uniref:uncharacterized protein LOC143356346 n=1 Tax=Halictus rubicundus TaxID=77578 RepID=UPI0040365ABD